MSLLSTEMDLTYADIANSLYIGSSSPGAKTTTSGLGTSLYTGGDGSYYGLVISSASGTTVGKSGNTFYPSGAYVGSQLTVGASATVKGSLLLGGNLSVVGNAISSNPAFATATGKASDLGVTSIGTATTPATIDTTKNIWASLSTFAFAPRAYVDAKLDFLTSVNDASLDTLADFAAMVNSYQSAANGTAGNLTAQLASLTGQITAANTNAAANLATQVAILQGEITANSNTGNSNLAAALTALYGSSTLASGSLLSAALPGSLFNQVSSSIATNVNNILYGPGGSSSNPTTGSLTYLSANVLYTSGTNQTVSGGLSVTGGLTADALTVPGNAVFGGIANGSGVTVQGSAGLTVNHNSNLAGGALVGSTGLTVNGPTALNGPTTGISGQAYVTGNMTLGTNAGTNDYYMQINGNWRIHIPMAATDGTGTYAYAGSACNTLLFEFNPHGTAPQNDAGWVVATQFRAPTIVATD